MIDNMEALTRMGFHSDVAEALHERGITADEAKLLSRRELMDHYLKWNGIIGFTDNIVDAVDSVTELVQLRDQRGSVSRS